MISVRSKTTGRHIRPLKDMTITHDILPLQDNWSERWCTLPAEFEDIAEQILNFEIRTDDVFLVTFMKSGTTWMQEAAWLLMNQLDFERAKSNELGSRSKFLEANGWFKELKKNIIQMLNEQESPRLIKSHLPVNFLPKQLWQQKQKIIYVARNSKDVVVSSYHFVNELGLWHGDINDYVEDFINNDIICTSYWAHVVDFWRLRHEPNIFFVTYEEMKRDLASVLQRLCKFLERPELTEEELKLTLEHLSFKNMRENPQINPSSINRVLLPTNVKKDHQFMRRGIIGCYKDELSAELQSKLSAWTSALLAKHGLKEEDMFGVV